MSKLVHSMYFQLMAIATLVSRVTMVYKNIRGFPEYDEKMERYEMYSPTSVAKAKLHRLFSFIIVSTCLIMIVPINLFRLYLISRYQWKGDYVIVVFFVYLYMQNLSMCLTEVNFILTCFGLNQKFQLINEDMDELRSVIIEINKYPNVLRSNWRDQTTLKTKDDGNSKIPMFHSRTLRSFVNRPLTRTVERLRARHQYARNAMEDLNGLYGIQLGLSLCVLCAMALFDIYGEAFRDSDSSNSFIFIYGWLLQYSFRFCAIVIIAHLTTEQARKSEKFITDINNRYLDNNTKEELLLFMNQISSHDIEFTACDFFTLNPHLITSVSRRCYTLPN
ncbi:uncharacterized protein LOC126839409 [Adelges cooleyi]|uniref:uncharacterized protein LOC126839409 n=1 Tax=Adelges cooleyi TaxID=133065 RepID=UPI00217F5FFA|nr:uncharacterized protein LOC126839409 [Adelges cooleyi]